MPEGWRPGQPLLRTCQLEPALEEVAAILGSKEVAAIPKSDEEEPLRQLPRKTRKKLPAEAHQFVREYAQIQGVAKAGLGAKGVEHWRAGRWPAVPIPQGRKCQSTRPRQQPRQRSRGLGLFWDDEGRYGW